MSTSYEIGKFAYKGDDGVLHAKWCAKISPNSIIGYKYCTCMSNARYECQVTLMRTYMPCPVPLCRFFWDLPSSEYAVVAELLAAHLENFHPIYSWFKKLRKPKQVSK